ncbi:hCG2036618, isoform CRA_a [Homo sapiens]|uniref:Putative uncharacterized protein DANCR n=1 Tax=Homo sapiens TaxID=9606 RepID=DANCR_HUMAN|nr:RecName: Full=Putative uncharacterized protein DANCR; AltName: Full=Anti-differentiation ncRNA protein; AltName: Full=Differentiation antagonizing non-protein coding RNA; AltName: Full=Small nucleolar RNA host gene protein 13 [Homo sapiens]EAX05436.1 hCG2036618, isoform CRA_a [Homo sapiens]EAX05437.1 hCG2036618, isoform CRA_a [Homo sapiens]
MAGPVPPHPGLAVRAAALHPAPLRIFPGLAELPDLSRGSAARPALAQSLPGIGCGPRDPPASLPAPRRLSGLCARRRSQASLSAGVARADAPLCSGFRAGHACGTGTQPQPTLSSRSSSLTSAEVQLPQFLAQVDNYRHKPLKLECPVAGISIDLSQLSLQLQ